jgi:ABC-type multidrug transport system ATPase subunit
MTDDTILETHDLTKHFGERVAVDRVTLAVPRGCAFGFLGHNGAGKTTTIRMLLGLTGADSGSMFLRGLPVPARRGEARARVGAIVEEPHFHAHLSGVENCASSRRSGARRRSRGSTARSRASASRIVPARRSRATRRGCASASASPAACSSTPSC